MLPEILEYSCYMSFAPLSNENLAQAEKLINASGLGIDIGANHLEFDYTGRDTNRKVVRLLDALAPVIGDANGEAQCRLDWEDKDATFEFYRIKNRTLLRQKARIVREEAEVVSDFSNADKQELLPTSA